MVLVLPRAYPSEYTVRHYWACKLCNPFIPHTPQSFRGCVLPSTHTWHVRTKRQRHACQRTRAMSSLVGVGPTYFFHSLFVIVSGPHTVAVSLSCTIATLCHYISLGGPQFPPWLEMPIPALTLLMEMEMEIWKYPPLL